MGWKENKQKHEKFVNKVTDLLMGISTGKYVLLNDKDLPEYYIENMLFTKYGWKKDKDYQMKLISKRKNNYHFKVCYNKINVDNIDFSFTIE